MASRMERSRVVLPGEFKGLLSPQMTARTGTSPAATTLTPESSEQPRETRDGTPLGHYESRVAGNDFSAVESVWVDDTPELTPERYDAARAKVSSPELASLAAEYLALSDFDLAYRLSDLASAADIRSLAASVLAQAEAKTNAGR